MNVPEPWEFAVLAVGLFRLTRLVVADTLASSLREWVTGRTDEGVVVVGRTYRPYLDEFLHCPWCVGFWLCLGASIAWWVWPGATLAASLPLALSAVVGLVATNLDE